MRKIYILLLFTLINNVVQSQQLCDEEICIIPSDVYKGNNEDELISIAVDTKKEIEKNGHHFDISCNYPSFWYFNRKGKKIVQEAKANGMTISVKEAEEGQRCDINLSPKFVQIDLNGYNYAVTDYYGDAVFVDKCFINIIMNQDYWCYGLPIEPTRYVKCKICNKTYKKIVFKSKDGVKHNIYNGARGKCTNGKNHDGIPDLKPIGKCSITKGRTVPTN